MCRPALLLFTITLAHWCQPVACQYDLWHAVDEAMVVCDPIPKPSSLPAGMTDSQWPTQKEFPVEIKYDHGMDIDEFHVVTFFRQHPGEVNITFDVKDASGATVIERTTVNLGVPVPSDCTCTGDNGGRINATYPADYGKSCSTWDFSLPDGCPLNSSKCCDAWCYVSADCKDAQSSVLNPGSYYSYEGACPDTPSVANCRYIDEDPCACTNVDNLEPYASSGRIAIEGQAYGATCATWSYEKACNDPQLFLPNETDLWCCQSWCWIKSKECRQAIASKKYPGLYWAPDHCPDDPIKVNACPFKASTGNEVVVTAAPTGSLCECLGYRPKMLSSGRRRMSKAWASAYGATCMAHDKDFCAEYHPKLDTGIWCCQSWCYVDEECPSSRPSTLAQGFFYSYEACPDDRQTMIDCKYSTVCKPSTTNPIDTGLMSTTHKSPSLPADYGEGCGTWDKTNCFDWWSSNANFWVGSKDWCCDSWTYVDTECPSGSEGEFGMSLSYSLCEDTGPQTYDVSSKQCVTRRLEEVEEDSDASHLEENGKEDKEDELEETGEDEDDEVADDEEKDKESDQDELLEGEEDEDVQEYEKDDEGEAEEIEDGNEDGDEHHDEHDSAQEADRDEPDSLLPQTRLRALASGRRRSSRPSNPGRRRSPSRPSSSDTRRRQAPPAARRRSPSSAPTRRRQATSSTTSGRRRAGPAPAATTPQRRRQSGPAPTPAPAPANAPRRRRTPAPPPPASSRRRVASSTNDAQANRRRAPATSGGTPTRRRQVGTDGRAFSSPARRRSPGSTPTSSSGRRRAKIGYTNPSTLNNNYNNQMPSKTAYGHTGLAKPSGSSAKIAMAAGAGVVGGALLGAGAYYAYSTYRQDTVYGETGVPYTDTRWAQVPSGHPEEGRLIRWDHCQQAFGAQCKDLSDCYGDNGCEYTLPKDTIRDDILTAAFLPAEWNGPVTLTVYEIVGTNSAWHKSSICVPVPNNSTLNGNWNGSIDPTWLDAVTIDTALYVTVAEVNSLDNSAEGETCFTDTKFPCQNSHSTCGENEQCTDGACECKPGWCLSTASVGGKSVPACTVRKASQTGTTSLASSQAGVPSWLVILCLLAITFLGRRI